MWRARMRGGGRKKEDGGGGGEGRGGGLVSLFRGGRREREKEKEKEKVLLVNREQLLYVFQRKY